MIRTCLYADCRSEQSFKNKYLRQNPSLEWDVFCIETEETVRGFPDVLAVCKEDSTCCLLEFKFTKTGKIKFQPTQPSFYRSHKHMKIWIVAYNAKTKVLHKFSKDALFSDGGIYCMNGKAEVDLSKAEKGRIAE